MTDHDFEPFAHLTAPNVGLYRAVMRAFLGAKQRFIVHMRPEDVRESLGQEHELGDLAEAMNKLVGWGNLRADPDTSRVTTVEDFHRARFLYQVTKQGEAAEQALDAYDDALGRRGALQAVALSDIAEQLRALSELARQSDPDPAKAHLLLRGLVDRFCDLADNAQAFMGSLQRTIDLQDADAEAFRAYKDQLIDYLERFIKDLVSTGSEISALVAELDDAGVAGLLELAARREAADAAPGPGDAEAAEASGAGDPREREFERLRVVWQDRWSGFGSWFVGAAGRPSQAKLLRAQARAAIPRLLQVVAALNERRSGRSDRSADFRSLAGWFAQAPDETAMHRLWHAAFGLSSARHLTVGSGTGEESVAPSTPWADAPPIEVSPRLRKTGSYERRGKANRVVDRSAQRQYLAEQAAQEAAETAAARAALATSHPTRLADLGELDPGTFRLFLGLLGDALSLRGRDDRSVQTTTTDGTMAIRLTKLDDARIAEIRTPHGVFRGPDHVVEIVDLIAADEPERRSA